MWVYTPASAGERCFGSSGYIYEPISLSRTDAVIKKHGGVFSIPEDIPTAIDAVYSSQDTPTLERYRMYEEAWTMSAEGKEAASLFTALNATIPSIKEVSTSWSRLERDGYGPDDEAAISTRLGRLGVDIAILNQHPRPPAGSDEMKHFLGTSVRLSHDELAYHLRHHLDESPWRYCGPLRYVVPLRFKDGTWSDSTWTLEYDAELGLRFRKGV